uniref:SDE2-like domain-containing protein n=1 Tax=Strombidinopsis acuminata TaxID=141414 RepID=A0A7S3T4T3_9SPIT
MLRLVANARELHDGATLHESGAPVRLFLRLLGGKGGFGAMLRTAGARGVKTTNFDACRDLNGRRLRHVNAEQKLREWEAQAAERERKKQERAARNAVAGPPPLPRFDDDAHEEMLEATRKSVADAVASSTGGVGLDKASAGASCAAGSSAASDGDDGAKGQKRGLDAPDEPCGKTRKLAAGMDPLAALMGDDESGGESSEAEGSGGASDVESKAEVAA